METIQIPKKFKLHWGAEGTVLEYGKRCHLCELVKHFDKDVKTYPILLERRISYSNALDCNVEMLPVDVKYLKFATLDEARTQFELFEKGMASFV